MIAPTIAENIKKNILTKGCTLYSEVEFLLRQELRETPLYNSVIEAVALGNTKLNDISIKSLIEDTSKTSVYLKNLIELEIIECEFSVDDGIKECANSRTSRSDIPNILTQLQNYHSRRIRLIFIIPLFPSRDSKRMLCRKLRAITSFDFWATNFIFSL